MRISGALQPANPVESMTVSSLGDLVLKEKTKMEGNQTSYLALFPWPPHLHAFIYAFLHTHETHESTPIVFFCVCFRIHFGNSVLI